MTWNGSVSGTDPYIIQVLQGADELSGGFLGLTILIIVFCIVYFANRNAPARESIVGAAWITMIVAILLRIIGALQDWYLGVTVVLALGSLALLYYQN